MPTCNITTPTNDRRYKVAYINGKGEHVNCDYLASMTHYEACTYKSKMMDPAKYYLYEVKA
jgi:hypothetical protein